MASPRVLHFATLIPVAEGAGKREMVHARAAIQRAPGKVKNLAQIRQDEE